MEDAAKLMETMRRAHDDWRARRKGFAIVMAGVALATVATGMSLAAALIGGVVHPITFLSCLMTGFVYGMVVARRPDRGARRKRLWFDYAMATLDHAADVATTTSLRDRMVLLGIAEGVHASDGHASDAYLTALTEAMPRISPRLQPVMMAHLHLALASRGVDLRRLGSA